MRKIVASLAVVATLSVGCSSSSGGGVGTPSAGPASGSAISTASSTGSNSSAEALARLCPGPGERSKPTKGGETPPSVRDVQALVEDVRGLRFRSDVDTEILGLAAFRRKLKQSSEITDEAYLDAQGRMLATMGAVPEGTDLSSVLDDFGNSQVIGFYDPATDELVVTSEGKLTPFDRLTLAHELVHAIEDQNFDLGFIEALAYRCEDDAARAALAVVEGSATAYSLNVVQEHFSAADKIEVALKATDPGEQFAIPESVPDFVVEYLTWPYLAGYRFVEFRRSRGGDAAVDGSIADPPASTEQVIHPAKYGVDQPQVVDVPDIAAVLGDGWKDLSVVDAGEDFISVYLQQGTDTAKAQAAASGWDGATIRSWAKGDSTVVVLGSVWDSQAEAEQFGTIVGKFAEDAGIFHEVIQVGDRVDVIYATAESLVDPAASALTG